MLGPIFFRKSKDSDLLKAQGGAGIAKEGETVQKERGHSCPPFDLRSIRDRNVPPPFVSLNLSVGRKA